MTLRVQDSPGCSIESSFSLHWHASREEQKRQFRVDFPGVPKNADVQIGPVVIGGDWIASDLIAGAVAGVDGKFGTADDTRMPGTNGVGGFKDVPTVFSKITSIVIGGQAFGTPGGTDHFGIVAQNIGSFKLKDPSMKRSPIGGPGFREGICEL